MKTYLFVMIAILIYGLNSCAAENSDEAKAFGPDRSEMESESSKMNEVATVNIQATEETSELKKDDNEKISKITNLRKWKKKAKQQLETFEDLNLILKDATLDLDFKTEIKNELKSIYPKSDSFTSEITNDFNFKNFKQLERNGTDTLTMRFNNNKNDYIASFLILEEIKQFGETTETVEQLKLVLIQKEN